MFREERFADAEELYHRAVTCAETDLVKVSALLGLIQSLRAQDKLAEASKAEDAATTLLLT